MTAMSTVSPSSKLKQVKIMLPADLHARCLQQAQAQGLSLAAYLRTLLYRELSPAVKNDKIKPVISASASPDLQLERVREIW